MPDYTAGKARILLEPTARGFYGNSRRAINQAMGGKPLTVDVKLKATTDGFYTDAERKVRATAEITKAVKIKPVLQTGFRSDVKRQADAALANLHLSVNIVGNLDLTRADAKMLAWRRRQEAIPLRIRVDTQSGGIPGVSGGAGSRNWRARNIPGSSSSGVAGNAPAVVPTLNTQRFQNQLAAAIKQAAAAASNNPNNAVKLPGKISIGKLGSNPETRRQVAELQRDFENNFRLRVQPNLLGVQLRLPLGSLGTQVIPGAVAAIGALISSIQELSQAGLALPGALSVAGASLGTFAVGISAIPAAWKALTAESDRAANSQQTDAARMVTAQNTQRNALVDVTRAQKDLNTARKDAKRALEDLRDAEKGDNLSVAEAVINLRRARNELLKPGQTALDRDENVLRELQAREGLNEALKRQKRNREDLSEAEKKGIEGSDQVTQAQENLVRATQSLADATTQLRLESSGAANAADKVKAAMDKLGPATAAAVKAVWDSKPAFDQLRRTVSENMFKGMVDEINALKDASLPLLYRRLGGLGTVWNDTLKRIGGNLRSDRSLSLVDRIFGNTEETQRQLNKAINPILDAILRVSAAGSDSMPRFAIAITDVSNRLANFIDGADKDGRLQQWIDEGMDAFGQLGRIIGNVATSVNGITKAFGGTALTTIENLTKKLSAFLNSSQGQEDLRVFIQNVRDDIEAWRPILQDLPAIFGTAMDAARNAIQTVLPIINVFTEVMEHSPGLITAVVTAFLGWSAIKPVISGVQVAATGLSSVITEIGTGFLATKAKAADAAGNINQAFSLVDRADSGPARAASRIAKFGAILGTAGPLFAGIGIAITALASLAGSHDDAADAAKRQAAAIDSVTNALDRVTKTAGAAVIEKISTEMQDFKPTASAGLGGNVQQAVEQLGLNPTAFAASALPGGETARAGFQTSFANQVRDTVVKSMPPGAKAALAAHGITENDVVKAFLGDPDAVKRFTDVTESIKKGQFGATEARALGEFDLGNVAQAVQAAGGQVAAAGLAGQFLNAKAPQIAQAQGQAQQSQRTATGKAPVLSQAGRDYFGNLEVYGIGIDTNGQAGLNFRGEGPNVNATIAELKARNNNVLGPFPGPDGKVDSYTVHFTEADAQQLLSYAAGGPTPSGKGRGPTGGHIVEVHDDEWVLPKHARRRLGDDMLWAWTGGNRSKKRSSFDVGGPGNIAKDLPPLTPPPEPHLPPGATPGAPVPAGPEVGIDAPPPAPTGFTNTLDQINAGTGQLTPDSVRAGTAPGAGPQDMGSQFLHAWFPWLGTMEAVANNVPGAAAGLGTGDPAADPLSYLAQWGGNFLSSFGTTLFNGVMSFFGLDFSKYLGAAGQVGNFYLNKFGGFATGQGLTADEQALYDANTGEYLGGPQAPGYATDTYGVDPTGAPATSTTAVASNGGLAKTARTGERGKGSGVIPALDAATQAKIDRAAAPGASVIEDANIQQYLNEMAARYNLSVQAQGDAAYRGDEPTSQHAVGRAGDLSGKPEDMAAFVKAWNSNPGLVAATRQLIYTPDSQTGGEIYGGAPVTGFDWASAAHNDHVHLALEGVPGYKAPDGSIVRLDVGGGSTVVSGSNASASPGWNPQSNAGTSPFGRAGSSLFGPGPSGTSGATPPTNGLPPLTSGRNGPGSQIPAGPGNLGLSGTNGAPLPSTPGPFAPIPGLTPGGGGKGALINLQAAGARRRGGRKAPPRNMGGRTTPGIAPKANYAGGNQQTWDAVYKAFLEAGFDPSEWPATVSLLNGESGWRPTVANPSSGAFGLFQFLGSTQKAYLPDKNPDPYIQGVAGMRYIKDRYGSPAKAWDFWQNQSPHWYDNAGMLPRGVSVVANQTDSDEVILKRKDAGRAKQILDQVKQGGGVGSRAGGGVQVPPSAMPPTTKKPGPPLAPDVDIPKSLPVPGISGPPLPVAGPQVAGAAPASLDYVHPALAKGISSGAATLGSLAATAASMGAMMGGGGAGGGAGAGMSGQMISGLFQQGGKVVTGIANVVSAAITGITKPGTTDNPYGVTLKNNTPPPPLAPDNRRIHYGDNNFASMDEWRRQTQIQDAQDQQAAMTRMKV